MDGVDDVMKWLDDVSDTVPLPRLASLPAHLSVGLPRATEVTGPDSDDDDLGAHVSVEDARRCAAPNPPTGSADKSPINPPTGSSLAATGSLAAPCGGVGHHDPAVVPETFVADATATSRLLQLQLNESEQRRTHSEAAWAERYEYAFAWSALAAAGVMSVIHEQQQEIDDLQRARAAAVANAKAAAAAPAPVSAAARDHEVYLANRKLIATDLIRELVEANTAARSELQQVIETMVEMQQQRRQQPTGGRRR